MANHVALHLTRFCHSSMAAHGLLMGHWSCQSPTLKMDDIASCQSLNESSHSEFGLNVIEQVKPCGI